MTNDSRAIPKGDERSGERSMPRFTSRHAGRHLSRGMRAVAITVVLMVMQFLLQRAALAQVYGPSVFIGGRSDVYTFAETFEFVDSNDNSLGDVDYYNGPDMYLRMFIDSAGTLYLYDLLTSEVVSVGAYDATTTPAFSQGYTLLSEIGTGPSITVFSPWQITGLWDGASGLDADFTFYYDGRWQAVFVNPPDGLIFQIDISPFYRYTLASPQMSLEVPTTGIWPDSNFFGPPRQEVVVNTSHFVLHDVNIAFAGGYYTESLDYWDPTTHAYGVTIHRSVALPGGAGFTGDIAGQIGTASFQGVLDPNSWQVSSLQGASLVTFSPPTGQPAHGPSYISWGDVLIAFTHTDLQGADVYSAASSDVLVTISTTNSVTVAGPNPKTGTYNPQTGQFGFAGDPDMANFMALNANGNPMGLPSGLTLLLGSTGFGHSILTANAAYSPDYLFRRPDGSWGVKYLQVPANEWFLIQDDAGNYNSQIYFSIVGERTINAVSGWPVSNAYPPQLYLNGVAHALQWATHYESGTGQATSGGVSYAASGGSSTVTLSWAWSSGPVWSWSASGTSGAWDGGTAFSDLPAGTFLSLDAPPSVPALGPARLAWNGSELTFDPLLSQMSGADAYTGAGFQLLIHPNHSVSVLEAGTGALLFSGAYSPATHLFGFGSAGFGTVSVFDNAGNILATSSSDAVSGMIAANLDIVGNLLTFGNWMDGGAGSVNGFSLSFLSPPSAFTQGTIQFGSMLSLTDWIWSSRFLTGPGEEHRTAMKLDAQHRVHLFEPANPTAPSAIVLDPAGGTRLKGPLRIEPQGGVSMGSFVSDPHGP